MLGEIGNFPPTLDSFEVVCKQPFKLCETLDQEKVHYTFVQKVRGHGKFCQLAAISIKDKMTLLHFN